MSKQNKGNKENKENKENICVLCNEEIGNSLFEHPPDICPTCYQDEIRDKFGYEGNLL